MISDWDNYQLGDILDLSRQSPADFIDEIKMEYIRPYLPLEGTILEVGAGSGRLLTRIGLEHRDAYKLIGLDYAPSSVKIIKANMDAHNLNGESILGVVRDIQLPDNSVDMICSGGLLEHFDLDTINDVLKEMCRVLKPGGLFYADIVPKKMSLCRLIIREDAGGYENSFSMDVWSELLLKNQFYILEMFSGLIIPPNFYGKWTGQKRIKFMYKHKDFIKSLDNTFLSDLLGFAYFVFARKGGGIK
jgi:ubiquinone/menaquinone biosynthesis C-methylase UbiE